MAKVMAPDDRPTVSLPDACIRLRISHQTGQRWLYLGVLQGYRVGKRGGRWRIYEESVREAEKMRRRAESATTT